MTQEEEINDLKLQVLSLTHEKQTLIRELAIPAKNIERLLKHIGEDPTRDGLKKTPERVIRALEEMTKGYSQDPREILGTTFDVPYDEVVILRKIAFSSLCEHHILPFNGEVDIGYIPIQRVVGISKLARLVQCFSKRLQVQERLTNQIANAINKYLLPNGVVVVVRASHGCMQHRGILARGAEMTTSCVLGAFRDNPAARAEFLSLTR